MEFFLQIATNWVLPAIFFLFVLSFCTMTVVELLDSILRWKSQFLRTAIKKILGAELENKFWKNALANPLGEVVTPPYLHPDIFASIIMRWITVGVPVESDGEDIPSSAENQEETLLPKIESEGVFSSIKDIRQKIKGLARMSPFLGRLLIVLADKAILDNSISVAVFSQSLETRIANWFSDILYQVGGQYKRFVQKMLFLIGLFVALITNFDVIKMISALWKMSLMKELVDLSQKAGQQIQIETSLFTNLPIGWQQTEYDLIMTPIAFVIKMAGIILGGFLIFVAAQYIYDFVKRKATKYDKESAE
jgi:hypothetical protein